MKTTWIRLPVLAASLLLLAGCGRNEGPAPLRIAVNDELGHAAGDEVLKHFARIAAQTVRRADIVGRSGGEEQCTTVHGWSLLVMFKTGWMRRASGAGTGL